MSAEALLSRLEKVKRLRHGAWKALCPAHLDKRPSLYITEKDEGIVLVKCMSHGCSFQEVVDATGVDVAELFPPKPPRPEGYRPIRRPFMATDVFDDLRHEATIVYLIACDLQKGKTVSEEDYQRLGQTITTVGRISEAAYGNR
jgi:hypothetical protein